MAGNRKTGYNNQRSYNSNGSYKTVYTAGSTAPDYRRPSHGSDSGERDRTGRRYTSDAYSRAGRAYDSGSYRNSAGNGRAAGNTQYRRQAESSRAYERRQSRPQKREEYAYQAAPAYEPQRRQEQAVRRPQTKQQRMAAERRKHIALRNQRRAARMNAGSVTFMTALILVCCLFAVLYIYRGFVVKNSMDRVSSLQEEVTDLKQKNNTKEAELYSGLSLNQIKKDAKKLGMTYAGQDQIIYFTLDSSDYVNDFSAVR